jgi:hypothetical protein
MIIGSTFSAVTDLPKIHATAVMISKAQGNYHKNTVASELNLSSYLSRRWTRA